LAGVRLGEPQFGWGGGREWPWFLWQEATGKVAVQPIQGAFEVKAAQVNDQVNGPATASTQSPVHKLDAGD
jgi:hypothetical protein